MHGPDPYGAAVPGHVIGVDVGSQSVKAALIDPDGATVATAGRPCAMRHPHAGWAEQDPAEWENALAGAVRAPWSTPVVSRRAR